MKAIFNKKLVGPLIFMLIGLLFFSIGSGLTVRQRTLEQEGVEAQGAVVDLQENYDSDGSTYTPVVRFRTRDGQAIEFVSSYSSSPPAFDVGESVTVVYPLENPTKAIIKGEGQLLHIVFMLLGGLVAAIGFYLIYSTIRDLSFSS